MATMVPHQNLRGTPISYSEPIDNGEPKLTTPFTPVITKEINRKGPPYNKPCYKEHIFPAIRNGKIT